MIPMIFSLQPDLEVHFEILNRDPIYRTRQENTRVDLFAQR